MKGRCQRPGFSLVELLIVVMIIGILAAIAIPKFSNASQMARVNSLKEDLRLLRTQIGVYRSQHAANPGYPGGDTQQEPTSAMAADQLVKFTDGLGNVSDTHSETYRWGPYLDEIPKNPVNGAAGFKILGPADSFAADGTTGWLYQPSTGSLKANVVGADEMGRAIIDY